MRIGIDFDNTIVCYDDLFYEIALDAGIIPSSIGKSKYSVKEYLITNNFESLWTELQGKVYGDFMYKAIPYEGVLDFLGHPIFCDLDIFIISHRTQFPYLGKKTDLHISAKNWVKENNIFQLSHLKPSQLFFETSVNDKLNRVRKQRCDIFIDDLSSFLLSKNFPIGVRRILFDPKRKHHQTESIEILHSWFDILKVIIDETK